MLSDFEQALAREMLRSAGVPDAELDWMVASCPSLPRIRELYARKPRRVEPAPTCAIGVEMRVLMSALVMGQSSAALSSSCFADPRLRMLFDAHAELAMGAAPAGIVECVDHIAASVERYGEHAFRVTQEFVETLVRHTEVCTDQEGFDADVRGLGDLDARRQRIAKRSA